MIQGSDSLVLRVVDGPRLKQAFLASAAWLDVHCAAINALNVFPVPDGDTGTNMSLTMKAAVREMMAIPDHSAGAIMHALAHGALMGARGNSGVILSQIFRGMARSFDGKADFRVSDFVAAFQEGAATAYKGVIKPVEGTILTVIREAAEAAVRTGRETDDVIQFFEAVVAEARASELRTPTLLQVLRDAGVTDSGGEGLVMVLEGMLKAFKGESVEAEEQELAQARDIGAPEGGYGYDVQFLIQGRGLNVEAVRDQIARMGESTLVVGDETTIKVHVHVPDPGAVLTYGATLGTLSNVTIENMQEQYQQFLAKQSPTQRLTVSTESVSGIATVAVVAGEGLVKVFESLGISSIVPGGQTMNPSTQDLLQAIESVAADQVILLPNNGNIIMAARQAQSLTQKQVRIIPSETIPQGIAALLAFNYEADLETNAQAMTRALATVQTAEITTAIRDANVNGIDVRRGQVIGLLNGTLIAVGLTLEQVVHQVLDNMEAARCEIITVYYGADVSEADAQAMADKIREWTAGPEIELVNGGQAYYAYILSAE